VSAALDLYAKLTETNDDKERARLIADAFEALEARFPQLNDLATQSHVRDQARRPAHRPLIFSPDLQP